MKYRGRRDEHRVDVITLQHALVVVVAVSEESGLVVELRLHEIRAAIDRLAPDVAQSGNLNPA